MIFRNDIYAITFDKNYSNGKGERDRENKKREKQRDEGKGTENGKNKIK
jgi:hypothetical protein